MGRRYILWLVAFLVVWLAVGAAELIELTGSNGQRVFINAVQITSLREPNSVDLRQFAPATKCVVVMASGKFVAVQEHCEEVASRVGWRSPPK